MRNNEFHFKEFSIYQQNSAMKVTTDACLFGAIIASNMKVASNVLDIGAGTGLLSLMVSQFHMQACYTLVEPHMPSMEDLKKNILGKSNFIVANQRVQDFIPNIRYDVIISNPPFFHSHLTTEKNGRKEAMHTVSLTMQELAYAINKLANVGSEIWVMLNEASWRIFEKEMKKLDFISTREWNVFAVPHKPIFRKIAKLSNVSASVKLEHKIIISDKEGNYTADFIELLSPYYLYL